MRARAEGHERLLRWARSLSNQRVWALEDCRHGSGGLERFLLRAGEQVARVPPKLMAGARRSQREFGKSDPIDATAVARAALREPDLPGARLAGPEREIALLLDHREDLVAERTRIQQRLRWLLHDVDPRIEIRDRSLDQASTLKRLAGRLRRMEQSTEVRICREPVRRCAELSRRAGELERELGALVRRQAPQLLALPGCGVLTAASFWPRWRASSGLDRTPSSPSSPALPRLTPPRASSYAIASTAHDNRQLNLALHRIAITQGRSYPPARDYLARRQTEGKTRKEALRALKRHLARRIFGLMVLLSQLIRTAAVTGRTDTIDASWFAGRQGGRWVEQTVAAAFPTAARHTRRGPPAVATRPAAEPAEALRELTKLHQRGVLTSAELEHLRARLGV